MNPIIKDVDFRREIKSAPRSCYFFFGEEDYLKNATLKQAREMLGGDPAFDIFNNVTLDGREYAADRLLDALAPPPMMAERKLVEWHLADFSALKEGDIEKLKNLADEVKEYSETVVVFSVDADRVDVVVHRESILHSAVEYIDNTVIGEFSVPDMRMCVQYAVDYPSRRPSEGKPLDLISLGRMTFFAPDTDTFPLLSLARRASLLGGGMGAVLNAADECAVDAFLKGALTFPGISDCVEHTFERCLAYREATTLEDRFAADGEARRIAAEYIITQG